MKIALIGPGLMPIPPIGWGAIEILIWKYYERLTALGHDVVIFNSTDLSDVAQKINRGNFDFIHLHYDAYTRYFTKYLTRPFCTTSHYGYILNRPQWSRGYFSIFADFFSAPGIIALSPEIADLYKTNRYTGPLYELRNGVEVNDFSFVPKGNGKVLCLGKIEPRKKQAQLARLVEGSVCVDFVGPIADTAFEAGQTTQYLGVWNKEEVEKHLSEYSALVLLSDGEAAPLVVIEALAAGVSVVVSSWAAANLDRQKPFITIVGDTDTDIVQKLHVAVQNNEALRKDIRAYATEKFDNEIIMRDYVQIITDFAKKEKDASIKNTFVRGNFIRYLYSRSWLLLTKVKVLRKIKNYFNKK